MSKESQRVLELDDKATDGPWFADGRMVCTESGMSLGDMDPGFPSRGLKEYDSNPNLVAEYRTLAPELARQVEALENKLNVDVAGVWHDQELFWRFRLGRLQHEISDRDLKSWLHNKSGLPSHNLPHDGCIRAVHTNAYIEHEIFTDAPK